jgi:hypothetical protein
VKATKGPTTATRDSLSKLPDRGTLVKQAPSMHQRQQTGDMGKTPAGKMRMGKR